MEGMDANEGGLLFVFKGLGRFVGFGDFAGFGLFLFMGPILVAETGAKPLISSV